MAYMDKETFDIWEDSNIEGQLDNSFEIDELIAPAVQELNRKGYKTTFSCSGHQFPSINEIYATNESADPWNDFTGTIDVERYGDQYRIKYILPSNDLYITFDGEYGFGKDIPLPDGFFEEGNSIRRLYDHTEGFPLLRERLEVCEDLYHWAQGLPDKKTS
jgi:hypothetical protein